MLQLTEILKQEHEDWANLLEHCEPVILSFVEAI